jgi:hypothetical protein
VAEPETTDPQALPADAFPDRPADARRASRFLLIGGGLSLLGGLLPGVIFLMAGSRLGDDARLFALEALVSLGIGFAEIFLSRLLRRPDRLVWSLSLGLSIVVVLLSGWSTLTLLTSGIAESLWGSVGRLLVGILTIQALLASREWYGMRT